MGDSMRAIITVELPGSLNQVVGEHFTDVASGICYRIVEVFDSGEVWITPARMEPLPTSNGRHAVLRGVRVVYE